MKKIIIVTILLLNITLAHSQTENKIADSTQRRAYILKETKKGGRLDFFTPIKGKEYEGIQVKPGVYDTRLGMALYKWGKTNFELGVNSPEDALALYAAFKGKELNIREKEYIKMGFNRELEK